MPDNETFGALRGIRVLDLTQMLAGPYGTMMLADHGATVIKIESPEGDMTRAGGPFADDDPERLLGGYFQSINRNKHSICLDLKTPAGKEAFKALVRDADAVVENFRLGVMERLGLGYEVLREINPKLVYGALRGFGDPRTGASPFAKWPAFDVVAQAMGGIMAITGADASTPTKVGPGVGDILPGMMLGFGVLAAIYRAQREGKGQFVDVSMVDAVLAICERAVWQHSVQGEVPGPEGNHHPFLCPFGMYPTSDGFVTVAAHQDSFFRLLCEEIGAPELATDSRFGSHGDRSKHRLALIDLISERTRQFTKNELEAKLGGKLPFGPVLNISEIFANDHFAAREMIVEVEQPQRAPISIAGVPIKLSDTPGRVDRRSPYLGEQTEHYLVEAGVPRSIIEEVLSSSAEVGAPV
ncbi:CaiB/BaiF CoA-transferase family protein [Novosphingobium sp. 9U]|uniref:CaiB/BaiF CoA transferase family protein n=1 Tax=Novosphingobium sp. 9U TaxID=2653158 RepID=UPI0012F2A016|nr:CoA transferase [Novosphingobium sp. 9U]VWX50602.1 Succinyl-CoA:mesaconate CoA-transferase [Novosphingobium sp. 9U]